MKYPPVLIFSLIFLVEAALAVPFGTTVTVIGNNNATFTVSSCAATGAGLDTAYRLPHSMSGRQRPPLAPIPKPATRQLWDSGKKDSFIHRFVSIMIMDIRLKLFASKELRQKWSEYQRFSLLAREEK
jgi:hypothetical protein